MRPVRVLRFLLGAVPLAVSLAVAPTSTPAQATPVSAGARPQGAGPTDDRGAQELPYKRLCDRPPGPDNPFCLSVIRTDHFPVASLPPCTTANGCLRKINQNGSTTPPPPPPPPPGAEAAAFEVALDVDAVSAACPACNILVVEDNDISGASLFAAIEQARLQGAKFISMSFGVPEFSTQTTLDSYFNHPGIAFVASAGNVGFQSIYPAASPYVTAAGGTKLIRERPGEKPYASQDRKRRGWHETAWSGTGSGCSPFEPKPSFQTDPDCPRRTTADVSAVADPDSGFAVYNTFPINGETGWFVTGGTSVAAPLIAGMYALAGTPDPASFPNSYPYARPWAFNDITEGSNGSCGGSYLCTAVPGYDGPTGIGTPNGVRGLRPQ